MLVLTRKTGQKLIISDNIEVIILETKGETVKIGINAPKTVPVYREELYLEIKKANQQAVKNVLPEDLNHALNIFEIKKQDGKDYLSKFKAIISSGKTKDKEPE